MKIDLNINVLVGDKQVDKINLNGVTVWQRITNTAPLFDSFTGTKTDETTVTLSYTVDNGGSPLTSLDYRLNNGDWTPAPSLALTGSIELTGLEIGEVANFELRAVNEIGETISQTLSFLISGEFVAFSEDFSDAGKVVDDAWRDENNGDPIAGEPVNVRVKEGGGFDSKMVQLKYLAWDLGQGNYPGTRRLEHPFSYFNVPLDKAYEICVDWYFENIFDFNTIGQDAATLKQRLMDHDGLSEAAADAQVTEWNPNATYAATGFPYQVGKMHGLISEYVGESPAGSNPKAPDEWSVRCSWVKNQQSHPTTDGGGVYTDGADPNIGPTVALYIYDQDREQNPDGSWPSGRYVYVNDFGGLQKETWYTIKLFVQINDKGKRNGIAHLRLYNRATDTLLASAYVDDLLLHDAETIGQAYIRRFMFSTFFGGGDMRFSPKLDPAWDSLVDVNSGVYARNDNYQASRIPALAPPVLSQNYNAGSADVDVTHNLGISLFDDIEYNITAAGGTYDPSNWAAPVSYTVTGETASFTIAGVNDGDDIRVRVVNGDRRSPRSDESLVVVPTVPDAPVIDSISELVEELQVNFNPPANDGDSTITRYEYRVDGGAVVQAGNFSDNNFTIASFTITGLTAGQSYGIEMRAVNAIGNSDWTGISTATPKSAYTFPIPTTGLRRIYDPVDLGLADTDPVSSWETPAAQTGTLAFEATAPTGGEPSYIANAVNGQPAVGFNGVDQVLNEVDPIPFGLNDEAATFYVVSKAHTSHQGSVLSSYPDDPANRINLHIPYLYNSVDYVGFDYGDRNNGGRVLTDWASSFNTWYVWEFRVKSGLMEIYRNGNLIDSSLSNSATPVDFISGERFQIGRFLANEYFDGEIAFIGMYNRYIEGQDRIDILNYFQTRFGLTINVPVLAAPTVTLNIPQVGDGQLTYSYSVEENGSVLTDLRYRVDAGTWNSLPIDPVGNFTITGLTNGQSYSVELEASNSIGSDSAIQSGTPSAVSEILVDDFITDFNSPSNVRQGIIDGHNQAVASGVDLSFSGRLYEVGGVMDLSGNCTWKGVNGQTILRLISSYLYTQATDSPWVKFTSSSLTVDDIEFDTNQNATGLLELRGSGTNYIFNRCLFHNSLLKQVAVDVQSRGRLVNINTENTYCEFNNCEIKRAMTDAQPSENIYPDGPWRPAIRGIVISSNNFNVHFNSCTVKDFNFVDGGVYSSGDKDIDGLVINTSYGNPADRKLYINNCLFEDISKRFIKKNSGAISLFIDGSTFNALPGRGPTSVMITSQGDYVDSGNAFYPTRYTASCRGHIKNSTFNWNHTDDYYSRPISISGQSDEFGAGEEFIVEGNAFEVLAGTKEVGIVGIGTVNFNFNDGQETFGSFIKSFICRGNTIKIPNLRSIVNVSAIGLSDYNEALQHGMRNVLIENNIIEANDMYYHVEIDEPTGYDFNNLVFTYHFINMVSQNNNYTQVGNFLNANFSGDSDLPRNFWRHTMEEAKYNGVESGGRP